MNPLHLEVSEQKIQILFKATCKIVAKEFHVKSNFDFPLILVLGDPNPRYAIDEENHTFRIYLDHWNEVQFATSAMRLAVHHLVPPRKREELVRQILRQSDQIAPVPLQRLGGHIDHTPF